MPRRANWSKQTRAVLAVLNEQVADGAHGYDLSARTGLKSGTLYPILMRLKAQGFLMSEWQASEVAGRPPRQIYQLSVSGRALAMEQAREHAETKRSATKTQTPEPHTGPETYTGKGKPA